MSNLSQHSNMIRNWKPERVHVDILVDTDEGSSHALCSPHDGYRVSISFTAVRRDDTVMRVRSTNWRAEHEPWGIVDKQACRRFYRQLLDAGFVKA